jgi:hypothetical protein
VLVEVKTAGVKAMPNAVHKGIHQLTTNTAAPSSMPILAVDEGSFLKYMAGLDDDKVDILHQALNFNVMVNGGIDTVTGLNAMTISRLKNLISEIKKHADQKPPSGYY